MCSLFVLTFSKLSIADTLHFYILNKEYRKPPSNWPLAARYSYHAICPIGDRGFGSVWLAKRKDNSKEEDDDGFVAIKVVGKSKSETISDFERRSQCGYL